MLAMVRHIFPKPIVNTGRTNQMACEIKGKWKRDSASALSTFMESAARRSQSISTLLDGGIISQALGETIFVCRSRSAAGNSIFRARPGPIGPRCPRCFGGYRLADSYLCHISFAGLACAYRRIRQHYADQLCAIPAFGAHNNWPMGDFIMCALAACFQVMQCTDGWMATAPSIRQRLQHLPRTYTHSLGRAHTSRGAICFLFVVHIRVYLCERVTCE